MNPGIYRGIPNAAYHGGPGISKSGLDLIHRSPAHYKAVIDAANDNTPTPAQIIGTAFHALLLEPDEFNENYCLPMVPPEGALDTIDDLKTALKAAGEKVTGTKQELIDRLKAVQPDAVILSELKQRHAANNAGRIILPLETFEQLFAMRDSVMRHPAAHALLTRAQNVVVDVKTTEDASVEEFARSIANWSYHKQHPYYLDGLRLAIEQAGLTDADLPQGEAELSAYWHDPETGVLCRCRPDFWRGRPDDFFFLAVEKKAPYAVSVFWLDEESIAVGRRENRADLDLYAECLANDKWPAYPEGIQKIRLPNWKLASAA